MTNVQWLLAVILVQHVMFGVLWVSSYYLRQDRRPAAHWAVMALTMVPVMGLLMLRGELPTWLSVGLGNLLLLMALVVMRRGIQRFCRVKPTDLEHGILLSAGAFSMVGMLLPTSAVLPAVLLTGLAIAWTLMRAAYEIRRGLAQEFSSNLALWCALPFAALSCLFIVRMGIAISHPPTFTNYLNEAGAGGVLPAFISLVLSFLLQVTLMMLLTLRLVRRLQHQSDHDPLTGLLTRRPMAERLETEYQRLRRHGGSFALLAIDIDHFKRINDEHGHGAGDAVLQRVANTLLATARGVDSVARMGGEEFGVLLPGADKASAERAAVRMLNAVRALEHPELGHRRSVSISIGLAVAVPPGESLQRLHRRVDDALYQAKASGRDCYRHADLPVETAMLAA